MNKMYAATDSNSEDAKPSAIELIRRGEIKTSTTKILETDDIVSIAEKIARSFEVGQSCTIKKMELCECVQKRGQFMDICTGEFVVQYLEYLIKLEYKSNSNRKRGNSMEIGVVGTKLFKYVQAWDTKFITIWRTR